MGPMAHLLEVEDLKVHFPVRRGVLSRTVGYVHAVDGVSLHVGEGETLGIVGESGCGKTTMGMAVLRLVEPTGGRVRFEGVNLAALNRAQWTDLRKRMQIIFQDPYSSLNPRMTVKRILGDPMRIHGLYSGRQCEERVAYLMEKVGLTPEQANRYPHQFSGGQRQRIGIARALCVEPDLIVADEPVSALDVSVQAQVLDLLKELQHELKLTYLFVAHNLDVVRNFCDRVAVMRHGRLVELAATDQLFAAPAHPYTRLLLSAMPSPDPDVPMNFNVGEELAKLDACA